MEQAQKVVAYARVSSREQAQKDLSIPFQLNQIRKYCIEHNYKLVTEYIDEGKSAKTDDRPAFKKMISVAKSKIKNFDAIVIHKLDRFSRNNEDHVIYRALLRQYGVKIYSVSEPYDEDTPHGFLSNGILQLISQFYNMNLATEVRKGMVENARRGYHNGGVPPYGYATAKIKDSRGNDKTVWVPGPDEQVAIIQRIFDMYVNQNMGLKKIVNTLNTEGVPSPRNALWSLSTVNSILRNEVYIGKRTWNKTDENTPGVKYKPQTEWIVVANAHQPLISRDLFNLVRERGLARCPKGSANWTPRGPSPFILRGILKCPECGANLITGQNSTKCRGYTRYYFCGTYNRKGKNACHRHPVAKDKIEKAIIDALIREFSMLCYPEALEYETKKFLEEKNREYEHKLSTLRADIRHLKRKIEVASNEEVSAEKGMVFSQYILQLQLELEDMEEQERILMEIQPKNTYSPEIMEAARGRMKDFANRIRLEPPDIQWQLIRQYVTAIVYDVYSQAFKMNIVIPGGIEVEELMMEKKVFFS